MLYPTYASSCFARPRQLPRRAHDHFALCETPEIDAHADDVVETCIRALVEKQGCEGGERIDQ